MRFVGLDVGTGNIVASEKKDDQFEYHKVKDVFFKIDPGNFMAGSAMNFGESMLIKSGANFVKIGETIYILGDDAFKFANLFHKECLRPMSNGVLNPAEPESTVMVSQLIKGVLGEPENEDDIVYYSIPADPIDADFDVTYHASTVKNVLSNVGYKNTYKMNEGLAIVYSELEDEGFSGIGISCGAGMVNVCYAFLGMPIFSFSIARSGDYIDKNAAIACNETMNVIQHRKEAGMDLMNRKDNVENAIAIYYESLIEYIVDKFNELYSSTDPKSLPNISDPIKIVVAGGTSMVGGFIDVMKVKIEEEFPIPVASIELARDPLYSVSRGLYNAAKVKAES
jgi:actin-like ATPase involved in cell morphogenesis